MKNRRRQKLKKISEWSQFKMNWKKNEITVSHI